MKSTQILLDCDDVLLDWIGAFRVYTSNRLLRDIVGEPSSWSMGGWLNTSDEVANELISEFNNSFHFGQLKAVDGAVEKIKSYKKSNTRLHVITSCSSDSNTVTLRRENLTQIFGEETFDSIHCLDLGQPKSKILQAWAPGALWIEDNYKNALMGIDAGHNVAIRIRPHNKEFRELHDSRITWFEKWDEL